MKKEIRERRQRFEDLLIEELSTMDIHLFPKVRKELEVRLRRREFQCIEGGGFTAKPSPTLKGNCTL
jgi:hypothetical protein